MTQSVTTRPDRSQFAAAADGHRRELLAYCYRMLGSVQEAEDLVQETYLRAWRSYDTFDGRASLRTYLYRVATNACLTALESRSRRVMPADDRVLESGGPAWLEPMPDALLVGDSDPATVADMRASVRLAFIAALQYLPPRRRAVLILRDVLTMPAAQVAELLGVTTAAVNSALPRARAQIARAAPVADEVTEPSEPRRAMLDRYAAAFHSADVSTLVQLLRADITLEMPPRVEWFGGLSAVAEFFGANVLRRPGQFRMEVTAANGQPAFVARQRRHGAWQPHAVHVLTLDAAGIAHIAVFLDPAVGELFRR